MKMHAADERPVREVKHGQYLHLAAGAPGPREREAPCKFRKLGFIDDNGALKIDNSLLSVLLRD